MNWRMILLGVYLPISIIGAIGLAWQEEIADSQNQTIAKAVKVDPLLDMKFNEQSRRGNLQAMGLTDPEIDITMKKIAQLSDLYHVSTDPGGNSIFKRISATDDQDALASAFCRSDHVPVRYAAMRFLVVKKGGVLQGINYGEVDRLEPQDWYDDSKIISVHEMADLSTDVKSDATKMAFAAILTEKTDLIIKQQAPYGNALLGVGWDWDEVKKLSPGIAERVMTWMAILHLTEEVAFKPDGLCT